MIFPILLKTYKIGFSDVYQHEEKIKLFQNSLSVDTDDDESNLQMQVIELQNNDDLKTSFKESNNIYIIYTWLPEIGFKSFVKKKTITTFGSS